MAASNGNRRPIRSHRELQVYQKGFAAATRLFALSKSFPVEERYSLTDQIRRSSRSVTANIAEAWRKRRYEAAFVSKLTDAEGEAAETQVWLEHAVAAEYVDRREARELYREYEQLLRMIVAMVNSADRWVMPHRTTR